MATSRTPSSSMKLVSSAQTLPHHHLDYVLDMAFDHYGRRFATASGDRTVRVWDLNNDGHWQSSELAAGNNNNNNSGGATTNEWQAHLGAVNRLSWAHPEFGQVLATGGSDHAVVIWEEREGGFKSLATPERSSFGFFDPDGTAEHNGASPAASRWVNKATLSDARRAVTAVRFAPRHLGLRLASGSADGCVRIYEAMDTMNLHHWKLDGVIEAEMEFDASGEGASDAGERDNPALSSNEGTGVSSLSWCTGRFEPPTLVVGFSSGRASIYRYNDAHRSWRETIRLPIHATPAGVPRGVLDVAWAPNVGRSYHLIATCGKDDRLKVHRIKRGKGMARQSSGDGGGEGTSSLVYEGTELLDQGQAWRCQWNVTGTVLVSSGDGGVVKLWKADFHGRWNCVSEIVGDTTQMGSVVNQMNQ